MRRQPIDPLGLFAVALAVALVGVLLALLLLLARPAIELERRSSPGLPLLCERPPPPARVAGDPGSAEEGG